VDFKNQVILITGASSGIGKETAIEFAKLGANIVLVARKKDKLEQTANELKNLIRQYWYVHVTFLIEIKPKKCRK
jgi:short-subunit dehydrogenase